jgi:hypothetical protein
MNIAKEIITELSNAGVEITVEKDEIICRSDSPIPDHMITRLKNHKRSVIAALSEREIRKSRPIHSVNHFIYDEKDLIPLICRDCPNLEIIEREDSPLVGCVQDFEDGPWVSRWTRFRYKITKCMQDGNRRSHYFPFDPY